MAKYKIEIAEIETTEKADFLNEFTSGSLLIESDNLKTLIEKLIDELNYFDEINSDSYDQMNHWIRFVECEK